MNLTFMQVLLQRAFGDLLSVHGQISASVPCGGAFYTLALAYCVFVLLL